jgi:23S rRNA pseudouridine2605 synthase
MHPRYGVTKIYRARLDRVPTVDQLRRLREGVEFERGVVSAPADVRLRNTRPDRPMIDIEIREGRYRQVRRMCEAVGLMVSALHRAAYGPLRLGSLPRGGVRQLTREEVRRLRTSSARPTPKVSSRGAAIGAYAAQRLKPAPARATPPPAVHRPAARTAAPPRDARAPRDRRPARGGRSVMHRPATPRRDPRAPLGRPPSSRPAPAGRGPARPPMGQRPERRAGEGPRRSPRPAQGSRRRSAGPRTARPSRRKFGPPKP